MRAKLSFTYMKGSASDKRFLFHYTTTATALQHIFHEGKLKFSSMRNSKDPLESKDFKFWEVGWPGSGNREVDQRISREVRQFGQKHNDLIKTGIKFACFSIDGTSTVKVLLPKGYLPPRMLLQKGYCRSRMWNQYAEGHAGVCIAFDKEVLLSCVKKYLGQWKLLIHRKVHYTDDFGPLIRLLSLRPPDRELPHVARLRRYAHLYFFSKLRDYRDEAEYRVCFLRNDSELVSQPEFCPVGDAISGLVLGSKFPEVLLPSVRQQAKRLEIPIFQLKWYVGTPYIEKLYPKR